VQLAELLDKTGLDVLDHLEREVTVPVIDGLQAQGDLIVVPLNMITTVAVVEYSWRPVPPEGIELVRGVAGNNPHTLVADPGTCQINGAVVDRLRLTIAVIDNTAPAYLVHPEHGASGIAPGQWLVRRQQESAISRYSLRTLIAD
jgi:hypothetical protein